MKRMVFKQLSSTLYTSITKNPPKICFFLQRRGLGMKRDGIQTIVIYTSITKNRTTQEVLLYDD